MAVLVFDLDEVTIDGSARATQATKPDGKLDCNVVFRGDLILVRDVVGDQLSTLKLGQNVCWRSVG